MQYRLSTLMLAVLTVAFALSGWQLGQWSINQPGAPIALYDIVALESSVNDVHIPMRLASATPKVRNLLLLMVVLSATLPFMVLIVGGRPTLLPMSIAFAAAMVAYCIVLNPDDMIASHPRAILNSTPWAALCGGLKLFYVPNVNRRFLILVFRLIATTFAWYFAVLLHQFPRY